jgi:hypothetical protein
VQTTEVRAAGVQRHLRSVDTRIMWKRRITFAAVAVLYLGLGVGWSVRTAQTWGDDTSDLSALDPAADGAMILVYLAGAAVMTRAYRRGQMRVVLATPLLLPVALLIVLVMIVVGPIVLG